MASFAFKTIFVVVAVAALCILSVSGSPMPAEEDLPGVPAAEDAPTNREERFYGHGGGFAASQASAVASSGATGLGLGYPYGHGLGLSTSHASAHAGAGAVGFGK